MQTRLGTRISTKASLDPTPTTPRDATHPPPSPRRIAIFVEPSPFTYVCGYANRFTNTIRCLMEQGCEVLVITTGRRL